MTATAVLEPPTNGKAQDADTQAIFQEKFLQIDLDVRRPTFSTKLTRRRLERYKLAVTTAIDDKQVDKPAELQINKVIDLLTDKQRKTIAHAYTVVAQFVDNPTMTLPSKIRGLRVLPLSRRDDFFKLWPTIEERFEAQLEKFFAIYEEEVVGRNRAILLPTLGPGLFAEIAAEHLPPLPKLRAKFSVRVVPGMFNYEDARDAKEAVEFLAKSVRDQTAEALASLDDKLKLGGAKKLTPETLNEVKAALGMLKAFSDLGDRKLLKEAEQLEAALAEVTAACAASKAAGSATTLTAIIKSKAGTLSEVVDSVAQAVRSRRGMDETLARFGAAPRMLGKFV